MIDEAGVRRGRGAGAREEAARPARYAGTPAATADTNSRAGSERLSPRMRGRSGLAVLAPPLLTTWYCHETLHI